MDIILAFFEFVCDMADSTAYTPEGGVWVVIATIMEWLFS